MKLDKEHLATLGAGNSVITAAAAVRYMAGVLSRERRRLAAILDSEGLGNLAKKIVDESGDDEILAFRPPAGAAPGEPAGGPGR